MKNLTIFTDPHLGTQRAAHTTRTSAAALKQELYHQAMAIVETAANPLICAGDLFDRANNPESTLVQGYNVASKCLITLAGNHDEVNREGVTTSLRALQEMGVNICASKDLSTPYFQHFDSVYLVPHHASQELFERAMFHAAQHAAETRDGVASYLILHCNYDFTLSSDDNTLNLSAEVAERLLNAFDFIFIGHEHVPTTHQGGRVVILGNTHPTSFSDISDKFIYHLEVETAELTKELIWSKDDHFRQIKLGDTIPDLTGVQFIEVIGSDTVANAADVNQFIQDVWKASYYQPEGEPGWETQLLAVRNKVELADSLKDMDTGTDAIVFEDLQTKIARDLEGTDLLPLFKELAAEASQ